MGLGRNNNRNRFMSEINATPLVDVTLVLLIAFMIAAPMMIHGVDVSLPETTAAPMPAGEEDRLVISITADQRVHINETPVEADFLREKLTAIMEHRIDRQVFLRADREVSYGVVVGIMGEVRAAGVHNLGMLTKPLDEKR